MPPAALPPAAAPTAPPAGLPVAPPTVPPSVGSWGSGTQVDPGGGQPAVLRWFTGSNWRPALRVVIAPTCVLLLAALLVAIPASYGGALAAPFGSRFGASLAAALTSLGAPFEAAMSMSIAKTTMSTGYVLRMMPMTVTALWVLLLWLGLRAGLRRRQAKSGQQLTRQQAFGEAARTGLVAAAVTLLLGIVCGTDWHPSRQPYGGGGGSGGFGGYGGYGDYGDYGGRFSGYGFTIDAGWLEGVGWTFLLAGLVALAVYGTDALRWAAWRNAGVRGWAVAGLTAGRVLFAAVGAASVAAFVVVAAQGNGGATVTSLAFLPNLGLLLLGYGSGATFEAAAHADGRSSFGGSDLTQQQQLSFFDMQDVTGDWRWAGLLALAAAALLGWTAFRRRLDVVDRIRLAVVYGVSLSLLMLLAGGLMKITLPSWGRGSGSALQGGSDTVGHASAGLAFATVVAANLIWAAVGALALPPLLATRSGRQAAAGFHGTVPAQAPYGADLSAPPAAAPGVSVPYGPPTTAPVVPAPVVPAPTDLLDSSGRAEPSGTGPAAGPAPAAGGEDPSVWRKRSPADS